MMPRADFIRADRALWRAVISQAINDATMQLATVSQAERDHAAAWLTSNGRDFRRVCALADLEPQRVQAYAKATIERAKNDPDFRRAPPPQPTPPKRPLIGRRTMVEINGERIDLVSLCARENMQLSTVRHRLRNGMTVAEAISKPVQPTRGRSKLQANEQGPAGVHPRKIAPNWSFSA